jgi:hypothetical protein
VNGEISTTASGTTGWTTESVLVHLNGAIFDQAKRFEDALEAQEKKNQQQFADADKAVRAAMAAASTASEKAEQNSEKWRANANEWRSAMNDRERNFAPIAQLNNLEKIQTEAREDMSKFRQTELEARTALRTEIMKEISELRESRSQGSGEKQNHLYEREHGKWIISIVVTVATSAVVVLLIQLMRH